MLGCVFTLAMIFVTFCFLCTYPFPTIVVLLLLAILANQNKN